MNQKVEKLISYTFTNAKLLEQALTHRSFSKENNERFEFLGDALINMFIGEELFHRYPFAPEGELSRLRSNLVKKETLALIADSLKIAEYLKLGQGELKSGGLRRESILADAFEAIVAAIYLDSDYKTVRQLSLQWFEEKLINAAHYEKKDPKTQLQEWLQHRKQSIPLYQLVNTYGEGHEQQFEVTCTLAEAGVVTTGIALSKRKAETISAVKALEILNEKKR